MKHRSLARWRIALWALLAGLVLALGVIAGCGGGDEGEEEAATTAAETQGEATGEPIKIGHLSTCEGPFTVFYEATVGGAMLPLIERGATPAGSKPSDGVTGATVAGHPIEIVWGCSDATPDKAADEARRLVEQEQVDILIGPLSGSEGIAVANYAKDHQETTFINGSSAAQDTTLKVQAPNFFRWGSDGAQWMAGLGAYAYNELGWRRAVVIGDDYDFPYTQGAGFVAEFCSLGGQVVKRLWPPLGTEDYTSYVAQIPSSGIDGFLLNVTGTGTIAFVKAYDQLKGNLADNVVASTVSVDPNVLSELGDRVVGVVSAGPVAGDDPQLASYIDAGKQAYPDLAWGGLFDALYYDAMETTLRALEEVEGDLSDGHAKLREAITNLEYDSGHGKITLDENRNSIADNFLFQVVEDQNGDGVPDVKSLKTIPQVDQTFAGFFSQDTPSPDRENPKCVKATPPPWATG